MPLAGVALSMTIVFTFPSRSLGTREAILSYTDKNVCATVLFKYSFYFVLAVIKNVFKFFLNYKHVN